MDLGSLDPYYTKPISGNWLGINWNYIDTVILCPNNKAYIFKGDQYVRYDKNTDSADPGYPMRISDGWLGLNWTYIDASVMYPNGKICFLRGINILNTTITRIG